MFSGYVTDLVFILCLNFCKKKNMHDKNLIFISRDTMFNNSREISEDILQGLSSELGIYPLSCLNVIRLCKI